MNEPIRETANSFLSVARNAIDLAKAELQVATLEAKGAASKLAVALGLAYLGAIFAQIALLILALSPILLAMQPWPLVAASFAIPTIGALAAGLAARRAFRRQRGEDANEPAPEVVLAAVERGSVAPATEGVQR